MPAVTRARAKMGAAPRDPVRELDAAAVHGILSFLGPQELVNCMLVSKCWLQACQESSHRLWRVHCDKLWADKAYVPVPIRQLADPYVAYSLSLRDAKRTAITKQELCHFTWDFKFKHEAGPVWALIMGGRTLRRWFHEDMTMTAPPDDPLTWDEGYTWQFRKSKANRKGCFVQVNSFPSLEPSRTADWGWRLENCWVTFTTNCSVPPNPGKGAEPPMGPGAGGALLPFMQDEDVLEAAADMVVAAAEAAAGAGPAADADAAGHEALEEILFAGTDSSSSSDDDDEQ